MELPEGLVTFLLTDVEGSTELWRADSDVAASAIRYQAELIGRVVAQRGGVQPVAQGEGDSTVAVFSRPDEALAASVDIQLALMSAGTRVRMGLHTGIAELVDETTYGGGEHYPGGADS